MTLKDLNIDNTWTLFLDRDGVINKRIIGGYVTGWDEFEFLPGVKESVSALSNLFGWVFIVTNQQGIGKGIMCEKDLLLLHERLEEEIAKTNGRIDKIYFSPHLEKEKNQLRKPSPGMGLLAKIDFPEIVFKRAIMVGDSVSDMQFGKRLGMNTVFIGKVEDSSYIDESLYDYHFESLSDFSLTLIND